MESVGPGDGIASRARVVGEKLGREIAGRANSGLTREELDPRLSSRRRQRPSGGVHALSRCPVRAPPAGWAIGHAMHPQAQVAQLDQAVAFQRAQLGVHALP